MFFNSNYFVVGIFLNTNIKQFLYRLSDCIPAVLGAFTILV
jgi:hypothetical protein